MSIQARRHHPRVCLSDPAFLDFKSGIRATVLDVSQGGLRFKTTRPLEDLASTTFQFTLNGGCDFTAELAWIDPSCTTAGLRFENVSPEVHRQIENWLSHTRSSIRAMASQGNASTSTASTAAHSNPCVFTEVRIADASEIMSPTTSGETLSTPALPLSRETTPSSFALQPTFTNINDESEPFASRSRKGSRVAMAALVLLICLLGATAAAEYFYPGQTRDAVARAQALAAKLDPQHFQKTDQQYRQ